MGQWYNVSIKTGGKDCAAAVALFECAFYETIFDGFACAGYGNAHDGGDGSGPGKYSLL
jgi:hypothetical protein